MTAPAISIDEAMADQNLFGAALGDLETWATWRVILKAAFALPLDPAELEVFAELAGAREPPTERVAELWVIAGRRGGKSRMAGLVAAYLGAFNTHPLARGETGYILALAVSKAQAGAVHDYARGYFDASPILRNLLDGEPTSDEIRLSGNVCIAVHPANFRTVRSRTLLGCIYDETAYWRDADTAANPDAEIYTATLPALSTTGGLLVAISSPYRRSGLLYRKHEAAFGRNDPNVLVVRCPSVRLNPTIKPEVVARAREMDPEAARSEWDAEFRDDLSDFLSRYVVDGCIEAGVFERPPTREHSFVAHCDPSGGSNDSMTLGIAHRENLTSVLDAVREMKPPFNPEAVVAEFADLLKTYRVSTVEGDRYAGEWVVSQFRAKGIYYRHSKRTTSEIYLEALPSLNSRAYVLLDNPRLTGQLLSLERRTSRTGRDIIGHPTGSHDDLANAALGALVLADKEPHWRRPPSWQRSEKPKMADPLADFR